MPRATWLLQDSAAKLNCNAFSAVVNPRRPQLGLFEIYWHGNPLPCQRALGVDLAPATADVELVDCYSRGGDLIAVYAQTPSRPARVQVYWRASGLQLGDWEAPCIDLEVSVQTSLLETLPHVSALSELSAGQALRLTDAAADCFRTLSLSTGEAAELTPQQGSGCLLVRWPELGAAYIEMVSPSDFTFAELMQTAPRQLRVSHRLFAHSLEKGVILRARVRAIWLSSADDERFAAAAYRRFAEAPPPLTT